MHKRKALRASGVPKEALEQEAFVRWARMNAHLHPGLKRIHSIANELPYTGRLSVGHRIALYRKLANMGMVKSMPDLFIPAPVRPMHGIYVEFKALDGALTEDQAKVHINLKKEGYDVITAFGFESAVRQILQILERGKHYE